MECLETRDAAAFINGLLSEHEFTRVERHICRCGKCRELVALVVTKSQTPSQASAVPSEPAPYAGLFSSQFHVIRELGAGGMGRVYEVLDERTGMLLALKTMRYVGSDGMYQLKREFRSLAEISHPNLVALYELVADRDQLFYTMEFIDGVDFVTYIRDGRPAGEYDEQRLRETLPQLAEALMALHAGGKVHRDIKPSNVLVTPEGRVVILDFGMIADEIPDTLQTEWGVAGTAAYMSPEQAEAQHVTPASDWYAVGSMLYECITGQLPFTGPVVKVLIKKQHTDPPPPVTVNPRADSCFAELCEALLARDPRNRMDGIGLLGHLRESEPPPQILPAAVRHDGSLFVGREEEMSRLLGAWQAARSRRKLTVAQISGPSGIGKTALLDHFTRCLSDERIQPLVLRGRCFEREAVPYKAFDTLVDDLTRFLMCLPVDQLLLTLPEDIACLTALFPILKRVPLLRGERFEMREALDPNEHRRRGFICFSSLLRNLSRLRPLVFIIDDLQWRDEDSLKLLAALLGKRNGGLILLLLAFRNDDPRVVGEQRRLLEALPDPNATLSVELSPLSRREADRLAEALMSDAGDGTALGALVAEARGNPFFIGELVRLAKSAKGVSPELSGGLEGVISSRFARLSSGGREILRLLSVSGHPVLRTLLAHAAGYEFGDLAFRETLDHLTACHLVRPLGPRDVDTVVVFHDMVRETVLVTMDDAAVRACHRALALAAEAVAPDNADHLASHWVEAGDAERAFKHLRDAARAADAKLAFDRAAGLYGIALDLADTPEDRLTLGQALGDALANAGRPGDAATAYNDAAAGADGLMRVELRQCAANQWLRGGYIDEGLEAIREVLAALGVRMPRSTLGSMISLRYYRFRVRRKGLVFTERHPESISRTEQMALRAFYSIVDGLTHIQMIRGMEFTYRLVLEALHLGDIRHIAVSLTYMATVDLATDATRLRQSRRLFAEADALARRTQDPRILAMTHRMRGPTALFIGDWQSCIDEVSDTLNQLKDHCIGIQREVTTLRWWLCQALLQKGRFRQLQEKTDRYLVEATNLGDKYAVMMYRCGVNLLCLARDLPEIAERDIEDALSGWSESDYTIQHALHLIARCQQHQYNGRAQAAWSLLKEELPRLRKAMLMKNIVIRPRIEQLRGQAALMVAEETVNSGTRERFAEKAMAVARTLIKDDLPHTVAWGALIDAGAMCQRGAPVETLVARLDMAIGRLEAADCQAFAAAAKRQRGRLIGGESGAALMREADAWFASEGVANPARFAAMLAPGIGPGRR